jgi:hypothetical protein
VEDRIHGAIRSIASATGTGGVRVHLSFIFMPMLDRGRVSFIHLQAGSRWAGTVQSAPKSHYYKCDVSWNSNNLNLICAEM